MSRPLAAIVIRRHYIRPNQQRRTPQDHALRSVKCKAGRANAVIGQLVLTRLLLAAASGAFQASVRAATLYSTLGRTVKAGNVNNIELSLQNPHKSIRAFPTASIPSFCLITGINGTGKTHLLEAIEEGKFRVAIGRKNIGRDSIRRFDFNSIAPSTGESRINPSKLGESEANLVHEIYQQLQRTGVRVFLERMRGAPWTAELRALGPKLATMSVSELRAILPNPDEAEAWPERFRHWALQASTQVLKRGQFQKLLEEGRIPPLLLTEKELMASLPFGGEVAIFQQGFAKLFVKYRDAKLLNDVRQNAHSKGEAGAHPLTDEEFVRQHGIPPWDFVNEVLEVAGLDFAVNKPEAFSFAPFELELRKRSTDVPLQYEWLSSGEKVLMALAHAVYYSRDQRQLASFPELLLLDEIDAPLHPAMSRQLLATIADVFVEKAGISVIATTHSPTTVALAPVGSLYAMDPSAPGLHKTGKQEALSILLRDVPTLALDFSGRRQVFVESDQDATIYDAVYQLLKTRLNHERSLTFIASGTQINGKDHDNGSAQVKRVVSVLAENKSVFGILDWDNKNRSNGRILILAEGERDGLENCIFDPIPLAILIAQMDRDRREALGLSRDTPVDAFRRLHQEALQRVADACQDLILGPEDADTTPCSYTGGVTLQIRKDYLLMDDHELEGRIVEQVPRLRSIKLANLKTHLVQNVLMEFPDFVPCCFEVLFRKLLTVEV